MRYFRERHCDFNTSPKHETIEKFINYAHTYVPKIIR